MKVSSKQLHPSCPSEQRCDLLEFDTPAAYLMPTASALMAPRMSSIAALKLIKDLINPDGI